MLYPLQSIHRDINCAKTVDLIACLAGDYLTRSACVACLSKTVLAVVDVNIRFRVDYLVILKFVLPGDSGV